MPRIHIMYRKVLRFGDVLPDDDVASPAGRTKPVNCLLLTATP